MQVSYSDNKVWTGQLEQLIKEFDSIIIKKNYSATVTLKKR